jgi:hypothetical protein
MSPQPPSIVTCALRHVQADLAPLIHEPGTEVFERLVDRPVRQFEFQPLGAGFLDVRPEGSFPLRPLAVTAT